MPKWTYGGTDTLTLKEDGKAYHRGDDVPLSKAQHAALTAQGFVFQGEEPKPGDPLPSPDAGRALNA